MPRVESYAQAVELAYQSITPDGAVTPDRNRVRDDGYEDDSDYLICFKLSSTPDLDAPFDGQAIFVSKSTGEVHREYHPLVIDKINAMTPVHL